MAVKLSPVYLDAQFIDGVPAVGAKLFTYAAGSTSKQATYTDSTGTIANSNPIILNARGEPPAIWLASGQIYKFVLASPTDSDPPTSPIRVLDNISGVNDTSINIDEWVASNLTPTYLSATQFTVAGDQTSSFQVNRRVKLLVSAGTVYGYISASSYSTLTTVTVALDSGALDTGLSQVSYSLLSASNPSVPNVKDTLFKIIKSTALNIYAKFDISSLAGNRTITVPDKSGTMAMTSDIPEPINATSDPTFTSTSSTSPVSPEWVNGKLAAISAQAFILQHQTSSGTDGGSLTASTWTQRPLVSYQNGISGASVASNNITLPAGKYSISGYAIGFGSGTHRCRIRNTSGTTVSILGGSVQNATSGAGNSVIAEKTITLSTTTVLVLEHWRSNTQSNGMGAAVGSGDTEVFAELTIKKLN